MFALTTVFLAPYLYWMIRVKPREASRRRAWALVSTAGLLLGAGLIFAAVFGSVRNTHLSDRLAYPFFTAWKGATVLCVDIIEVLPNSGTSEYLTGILIASSFFKLSIP